MEEPGRLQSMGSLRVGYDWATSLSLFTFIHWRRKWQPTPVFLPGESQGWGSLVAAVCGITQSRTWLKWLSSSSSSCIAGRFIIIWPTREALKNQLPDIPRGCGTASLYTQSTLTNLTHMNLFYLNNTSEFSLLSPRNYWFLKEVFPFHINFLWSFFSNLILFLLFLAAFNILQW